MFSLCMFQTLAMASTFVFALLAIFLVVQPITADPLADLLAPIFSPIVDEVCKEIECGKGTCKPSSNSTFLFECQCDAGWKQVSSDLRFLPCVIPNCNLNYSCTKAPAPVANKTNESSVFDPCVWSYCGGGSCNKTSKFTYNCECATGYSNLLNVTGFPCYEECSIGMDCANLGISIANKSTGSPPLADDSKNQASSTLQFNSAALVILMMFAAVVHWK